jgi:hypothetical protein
MRRECNQITQNFTICILHEILLGCRNYAGRDVGYTQHTEQEMRNIFKILAGKLEGKNHLGHLGVDGRISLKWKEEE